MGRESAKVTTRPSSEHHGSVEVVVVLLNLNRVQDSIACIESVLRSSLRNIRVVVLDNGSKNDEGALLKQRFANSLDVLRSDRNLGVAAGWNRAISFGWMRYHPLYFFILIDDMVIDPSIIEEIRSFMETTGDAGVVGAPIARFGDPQKFEDNRFEGMVGPVVDYLLLGGAMMIRKEVLDSVGLFDEDFFIYGEENDLMERLRSTRWRPYCIPTKGRVYHKGAPSSSGISGFAAYHRSRNMLVLRWKDYRGTRLLKGLSEYFLDWLPREIAKDVASSDSWAPTVKARIRGAAAGLIFPLQRGRGSRSLPGLGDDLIAHGLVREE